MTLLKLRGKNKKLVIKILIGLLLISNISLGVALVNSNNKIELLREDNTESSKIYERDVDELQSKITELNEKLSVEINSESDLRIIRKSIIDSVQSVVDDRKREIDNTDILRALNSAENRIMDEYIRVVSLILATMETESNFKYIQNKNTNGTMDYGIMQVNDVVIPHLKEALGDDIDPINSKDDNVESGSWEIYDCYLQAKEKHPDNVIWWTYAYYNRGKYFEGTDQWKNPNNPNYKAVHKQADVRSKKFMECYNAYYEELSKLN